MISVVVIARVAVPALASVSQRVQVVVLGTEFPPGGSVPAGPSQRALVRPLVTFAILGTG
ncbi:hypothetical protein [[Mycobacterium] vasticus]|uniref:Secreted protein n=1 Tax=[Mycobacterium] vasticus TaxID=2875777 RepID=A0ABU5YUY1_9MYCO|nr:hypothetical protein [Mycolicibacter sp. MYC017]MEB3068842.1 hypothetical protein [Mycolicibacter sp. MYC017]